MSLAVSLVVSLVTGLEVIGVVSNLKLEGMKTEEINFSPVHIRTKDISGGKKSLYLDIAINGSRTKEYLHMYLLPGTDRSSKARNRETMRVAEEIRAKRILQLQADDFQLQDKNAGRINLIEWLNDQQKYYHENGNMNYSKTIHNLIRHLDLFDCSKMMVKDVTPPFLRKFLEYLKGNVNKYGGKLSEETVYTYFTVLSILMNKAVRLGIITRNPFHQLGQGEKPQRHTKKKEYLTLEEVKKLAATECDDWRVKHAFLFCCFTGLRYIDVSRLKWKDIIKVNDNEWKIEIIQQKTKEPAYIPLSENARKWLPEQGYYGRDNYIFQFRDRSIIYDYLDRWAKAAGIEKHVTFHMSRHTCATLLLYYGADLYTVSKILGHTSIKTTQVYAKVVDDMKVKAVNNIPDIDS